MTKELSNNIVKKLMEFYGKLRPALKYKNIYQLAVSVVLSAQTTDRQVNSVTPRLFCNYSDFACLAKAEESKIQDIIKSTGFYKNKSANIINLSKKIVDEFNGILPETMEDLITLPGIGRKSANVILSAGFNKDAFAVDTHIIRIANRLGYIESCQLVFPHHLRPI